MEKIQGKRRFEPNTFHVLDKCPNHYATEPLSICNAPTLVLWITECFDKDIAASSHNLLITSEGEVAHSVVGDNIPSRDVMNVIFL